MNRLFAVAHFGHTAANVLATYTMLGVQDACVLVCFFLSRVALSRTRGAWGGKMLAFFSLFPFTFCVVSHKMLAFLYLFSSPVLRSISLLFPVYVCMLISLL